MPYQHPSQSQNQSRWLHKLPHLPTSIWSLPCWSWSSIPCSLNVASVYLYFYAWGESSLGPDLNLIFLNSCEVLPPASMIAPSNSITQIWDFETKYSNAECVFDPQVSLNPVFLESCFSCFISFQLIEMHFLLSFLIKRNIWRSIFSLSQGVVGKSSKFDRCQQRFWYYHLCLAILKELKNEEQIHVEHSARPQR